MVIHSAHQGWFLFQKSACQIFFKLNVLVPIFLFQMAFQAHAQKSENLSWATATEIEVQKNDIEQMFTQTKNQAGVLHVTSKKSGKADVAYSIINHMNPGANSGAIAATIKQDDGQFKLLLNRKERYGKLVYWIAILPAEGDFAFKLKSESSKGYLLERVSKNEVVTD